MPKVLESKQDGSQVEYAGKSQSTGNSDAGEFVVLGSDGKLDPSLLPSNVGADVLTINAGEDLAAGDFVRVNSTGEVVKASAGGIATQAQGYVKEAVANGQPATVYFDDDNSVLSGLTPGSKYFLSAATAGAVTLVAPVAAGEIVQVVGFAVSATTLHVDVEETPTIRI